RTRAWVLPEAERVGFGPARWWDLEAEPGQVLAGCFGRAPALRRSIEEAEPQQERLVDVLDRLDLLGEDGTQGSDADWPRLELLDDRGEQLPIGRVEALVVDLHRPHRLARRRLVDAAVAVDLGVIADPLQQPVDDPWRSSAAPRDRPCRAGIDLDIEDSIRSLDDLDELIVAVEVEPVRRPEPVAQRRADPPGAGRRADAREGLEAQPQRPRRRPLADQHVECVVLHRGIEDLLDGPIQAVDLVDEQDVAFVQSREKP